MMGIPILARLHLYTECYDGNSYTGKTASIYRMFMMGIPKVARLHLYTECL